MLQGHLIREHGAILGFVFQGSAVPFPYTGGLEPWPSESIEELTSKFAHDF